MNLQTLEPSRWKAREKYLEYLNAEKTSHDKRIGYIKNAYRELSRGATVIDILQIMRAAGLDSVGRPKLAICRANAKWCFYRRDWNSVATAIMFCADTSWPRENASKTDRIRLPVEIFAGNVARDTFQAMLPTIPPEKLVVKPEDLGSHYILWEAEWQGRPPVDPALLKHLGGPFYSVLSTWDLTAVERAALEFSVRM